MTIEAQALVDAWVVWEPGIDLLWAKRLRFGGRLVCEFVAGGNRPDIKVLLDDVVTLVGEVKGRSDLSNVWESWMPQINGHLQTWTAENSQAPRCVLRYDRHGRNDRGAHPWRHAAYWSACFRQ